MYKVRLMLLPACYIAMILRMPATSSLQQLLQMHPVSLILAEYRSRITPHQWLTWQTRNQRKRFAVYIPLSVAIAVYELLQQQLINPVEQILLNDLDKTLKNHGLTQRQTTILS